MNRYTQGLDRLIDNNQRDLDEALAKVMVEMVTPELAILLERGALALGEALSGDISFDNDPFVLYAAKSLILRYLAELFVLQSVDERTVIQPPMLEPEFIKRWFTVYSVIIESKAL